MTQPPNTAAARPKRIRQSFALREFYRAYQFWLDHGAPERRPFMRHTGLCGAVFHFCQLDQALAQMGVCDLRWEMQMQFMAAGLDIAYPFGGERFFNREIKRDLAHRNEDRIAWVREHAR